MVANGASRLLAADLQFDGCVVEYLDRFLARGAGSRRMTEGARCQGKSVCEKFGRESARGAGRGAEFHGAITAGQQLAGAT